MDVNYLIKKEKTVILWKFQFKNGRCLKHYRGKKWNWLETSFVITF